MKRVYIDGVFDLFHRGHLESLKKAKEALGDPEHTELIVGVVSDRDCESYKRTPIVQETDRYEIIKHIKGVDEIVFPCPLLVTMEFLKTHRIDYVVHGFSDEADRLRQKPFFAELIENGKFIEIEYYKPISTTSLIKKMSQ
jgi:choline-phosphate cytidylyltransferase